MSEVIWVDDDQDCLLWVARAIRKEGLKLTSAFNVARGLRHLRMADKASVRAVILDVILPIGTFEDGDRTRVEGVLEQYRRYTGLALVSQYPEWADRMIILSIVPERQLRDVGVAPAIPVFSKVDIAEQGKSFRDALGRLAH